MKNLFVILFSIFFIIYICIPVTADIIIVLLGSSMSFLPGYEVIIYNDILESLGLPLTTLLMCFTIWFSFKMFQKYK